MEISIHEVGPLERRGYESHDVYVSGQGVWPWYARFSFTGTDVVGIELWQRRDHEDDDDWEVLTATDLRRLPIGTWERAARAALIPRLEAENASIRERVRAATEQRQRLLTEVVRVYPGLVEAPDADKSARRRFETAMNLAGVADEYRSFLAAGLADPVAAIARKRNVSDTAARSLVYRARKEGFLGPARGPTAGEAVRTEEG